MAKSAPVRLSDLRAFSRLATDATLGLTDLVEAMHHTIRETPAVLGASPKGRTGGITGFVYGSVRGVAGVVGASVDTLLGLLAPLITEQPSPPEREAVVAALNGVLGDYLVATRNPLAIAMHARVAGTPVILDRATLATAYPEAGRNVVVLVHGLCMNDLQWKREGHDHGAALARDLGCTPVYLHYNTGRHIAENGREFAALMEELVVNWPHAVDRLSVVTHSMGGLVARSAVHHARLLGHAWPDRLHDLVFLGTPHFGASLERAGARADFLLGISPYTAPLARLGKLRSAGIKDLRHGYLRDDSRSAHSGSGGPAADALPLPDGVACYAIAASRQQRASAGRSIRGDGLVAVNSALGIHREASCSLAFPGDHRRVFYGIGHFDLLGNTVYEQIRHWLGRERDPTIVGHAVDAQSSYPTAGETQG